MTTEKNAREVVLACVEALNREDFEQARRFVNDNFTFEGVLGSRHGAEAYFDDMLKMRLKYEVKKVLSDNQDVCLFYDLTLTGQRIFGCAWYHIEAGTIRWLRVVFDLRPLLERKAA